GKIGVHIDAACNPQPLPMGGNFFFDGNSGPTHRLQETAILLILQPLESKPLKSRHSPARSAHDLVTTREGAGQAEEHAVLQTIAIRPAYSIMKKMDESARHLNRMKNSRRL